MQTLDDFLCRGARFKPRKTQLGHRQTSRENDKCYLTKAMILGGLLKRVWKNRLLIILYGLTSAESVGSSMLSGRPSMYKFVEDVSFRRSIRDLNESGGSFVA